MILVKSILLLVILVTSIIANDVVAAEFNAKGYKIKVYHEVIGRKKLKASGTVRGGRKCKFLKAKIWFANSKTSSLCNVEVSIPNYRISGPSQRSFKAYTRIYDKKGRWSWHIDDIYVKCLN